MQPYASKNGLCKKHQPKIDLDGRGHGDCCSCFNSCKPCCKPCGFVYEKTCKCVIAPILKVAVKACPGPGTLYAALDCLYSIVDFGCEFNCFTVSGCCGPKSWLGCINCINPRFACAGTFAGSRYQRDKPGWLSVFNPCSDSCAGTPSVECLEPGCKRHIVPKKSKKSSKTKVQPVDDAGPAMVAEDV